MGREVSLPGPAVRIVSLAASNTEILFSIDAGPQTAGRDDFSDQPAEAQALPSVGGTDGSYDMELFTDLAPDLVLLGGSNTVDQINAIEDAGFTYYYVHDPATLEDFFKNIGSLGILTGQETAAESLVTSLQDRVDIVISTLSGITERPIVFYEREVSDTPPRRRLRNLYFVSRPGPGLIEGLSPWRQRSTLIGLISDQALIFNIYLTNIQRYDKKRYIKEKS